jgi:PBSX family phage terminase large subunit
MKATIVFEKIWNAINATNPDGSRKYKYIINTGSSRSSKTYSILQIEWIMCLKNPNTRVSIWRETKADCKMTILADLKKAVPTFPNLENVTFNKTESIYTFPNGSTIEFMGGDEENRVHGFQGNIAHLNEPYKFGLEAFDQIDMRTSDFIIIDWNPKNKHWIDEVSKRDNAIVIHSTFKDNPFIPDEQKKKILSYDPSNQYNVSQGTANNYLWQVYGLGLKAEKPNRIFKGWKVIESSTFDKLPYQSYYATDFGLSAPSANLEFKFDGDKSFFFKERLYKPMNQMKGTLVEEFERLGIDKTKENICDSGNEINQAESRKLKNAGHNIIPAKKGAGSISAGIETIQKCKIYYTKCSVNLENEYENYSWRIYQSIQMDEPEQNNEDHLLDCARMGVSWYVKTRRLSI